MNYQKMTKELLFSFFCFCLLTIMATAAIAVPVAMITDKQGKISMGGK